MTGCTSHREQLGAYVLGGLDDVDAAVVDAHLQACASCRAEHAELMELPPLLALAETAPPPVPERVRDRIVAEATRRRQRRRWGAAVAAVAVVSALLGGLVVSAVTAPRTIEVVTVALEPGEDFTASGWATFRVEDGAVTARVDLDGLDRLQEPAAYEAWLSAEDELVSLGQFTPSPDGTATLRLDAPGPLERYRGFWVTAEPDASDPAHDGPTVLRAYIPDRR